jgi:hypothetical protein
MRRHTRWSRLRAADHNDYHHDHNDDLDLDFDHRNHVGLSAGPRAM